MCGARSFLSSCHVFASLVLDDDRSVVFVRAQHDVRDSFAVGEALKVQLAKGGKTVDAVYWKFAENA